MKIESTIKIGLLCVFCISLFNCSSLFNNKAQKIMITPAEGENIKAQLILPEGKSDISLPFEANVTSTSYEVYVKLVDSCYKPLTMKLPHEMSSGFTLNIAGIIISPAMVIFAGAADVALGKHKAYSKTVTVNAERLENCK